MFRAAPGAAQSDETVAKAPAIDVVFDIVGQKT